MILNYACLLQDISNINEMNCSFYQWSAGCRANNLTNFIKGRMRMLPSSQQWEILVPLPLLLSLNLESTATAKWEGKWSLMFESRGWLRYGRTEHGRQELQDRLDSPSPPSSGRYRQLAGAPLNPLISAIICQLMAACGIPFPSLISANLCKLLSPCDTEGRSMELVQCVCV